MNSWIAKARAVFADEGRFWAFATGLLTAIAVLKGLRVPNDWAATQAQLRYDQGFVKRGLFGQVFSQPLGLGHYARFTVFSTVLFLLLILIVVVFARRTGVNKRAWPAIACAVFGASYSVTYLAHLNGYLDIPVAILSVGMLLTKHMLTRFLLAVPGVIVGILLHEMYVLMFLPVLLLTFLLQGVFEGEGRRKGLAWAMAVSLGVLGFLVFEVTAQKQPMTAAQGAILMQRLVERTDFAPRTDFPVIMMRSIDDGFVFIRQYHQRLRFWLGQLSSLVTALPTLLYLLWMTRRMLRQSGSAVPRWLVPLTVLAALSPILMNTFGLDTGRWWALAGLSTFLVFGCVCRYATGTPLVLSAAAQRMAILVIAVSMASGGGLLDHAQISPFPFTSESAIRALHMQSYLHPDAER